MATHYNPLYWACACLCCNAGNTVQDVDFDEDEESAGQDEESPQNGSNAPTEASEKKKRAAPNYGKIAKAISDAQMGGIEIGLPDINEALEDFVPDVGNNRIIYSLRAVNAVSDQLFSDIMANRPFSSLDDFLQRIQATSSQIIGLIKAGCFDALEGKPRQAILRHYVERLAEEINPVKEKLTAAHIKKAIQTKMPLTEYRDQVWMVNFKKWIDEHQLDPSVKNRYLLTDPDVMAYFKKYVEPLLSAAKDDYAYVPGGVALKKTAFEKAFNSFISPLKDYFASEEGRQAFARHLRSLTFREIWERDCSGNPAQWEMEQMCFYHGKHELAGIHEPSNGIVDFNKLPETPETESYRDSRGELRQSPKTCALAGTIVHVENQRHIVWLLTTHGVVSVKFYADLFNKYKAVLSVVDPKTGRKTVVDKPWLKRGEKILVYGYRREDAFVVRSSRFGNYRRTICRIESVAPNGEMKLQFSRTENEN